MQPTITKKNRIFYKVFHLLTFLFYYVDDDDDGMDDHYLLIRQPDKQTTKMEFIDQV